MKPSAVTGLIATPPETTLVSSAMRSHQPRRIRPATSPARHIAHISVAPPFRSETNPAAVKAMRPSASAKAAPKRGRDVFMT